MTIVTTSGHASNTLNYWMAKYSLLTMQPHNQATVESKIDEKFKESRNKLSVSVKPLVTFLLGALVGAAAMTNLDFWCILLPMGVVLVKIVDISLGYFSESECNVSINTNTSSSAIDRAADVVVVHSPVVGSRASSSSPTGRLTIISPEVAMEAGELTNVTGDSRL
jgi:hypothetical protein